LSLNAGLDVFISAIATSPVQNLSSLFYIRIELQWRPGYFACNSITCTE
jgi:hypothetical protein